MLLHRGNKHNIVKKLYFKKETTTTKKKKTVGRVASLVLQQ